MEIGKTKVFVFGRGDYYNQKKRSISSKYEVIGFLDNSVEFEAIDENGVPIYNPNRIINLPKEKILCISVHFLSMWKQLIELGVECERILFGCDIEPLQEGFEKLAFSNGEILTSRQEYIEYIDYNKATHTIRSMDKFKEVLRKKANNRNQINKLISLIDTKPVSRVFATERGIAVDRVYIEKFLETNSKYIKGTVMEVANDTYSQKYGKGKISKQYVSHVKGWGNTIKINFETGEGITDEMVDCLICTQTLQYIFDIKTAFNNIYRLLAPNGCALITVPGIKPICLYDDKNWGEYWSFTKKSLERLCQSIDGLKDYEVVSFGNVKIAMAYLYGICVEELLDGDFEISDPQYPFLLGVKIRK